MNVDTLLEAAKYLEEQEEKAKQRQILTTPDISTRVPIVHQNNVQLYHHQQQIQPNHQQITTTAANPRTTKTDHTLSPITVTTPQPTTRVIKNSFDIINRLVIDESGEQKRKQPPIAFRAGTREVHNKLEKDRRAHLKECFDILKKQLPRAQDERKSSNLSILHSAIRYISSLKKKERELEHEMEQLARQKIAHQQKIAVLKKDMSAGYEGMDFSLLLPEISNQGTAHVIGGIMEEMEITPTVEIKINSREHFLEKNSKGLAIPRSIAQPLNGLKEGTQVQTTSLSVLPLPYQMSQVVLQKVALVPKNLSDLPLVSSPTVAHLITPQQIGGKVVPIVNAQYVVKPVVVVSTPSRQS